jgi:hypothetical protein
MRRLLFFAALAGTAVMCGKAHARDINSLEEFETVYKNALSHSRSNYNTTMCGHVWNGDGYNAREGGGIMGGSREVCFTAAAVCFNEYGQEFTIDREGYYERRIRDRWPSGAPPDLFVKP